VDKYSSSFKRYLLEWNIYLKNFFKTLALVVVPMILYIPVMMTNMNLGFVVDKLGPEWVMGVLLGGSFIALKICSRILVKNNPVFFPKVK